MQFKDVIGQHLLKQELPQLMQENRLAHALLFLGREGAGALPLAMAFAQYILCEKTNPLPGKSHAAPVTDLFATAAEAPAAPAALLTDACGQCPACRQAAQLAHPDIHFTYPVVTKKPGTPPISTDYMSEWREFVKQYPYGNVYDWLQFIGAENKQGNITATECNEIIKKLSLKSFEGGYKVHILWMPEFLGTEGNKLLKLIEEPPPQTVFLWVAQADENILPTLLSRCQLIKVPALAATDVAQALTERNHTAPDAAANIAAMSQGNYREALHLSRHLAADWQHQLRDWLNAMLKSGTAAQIKWVEEISRLGRENQKQFLQYFNHLLQLAIRLQVMPGMAAPDTEKDFALRLNKIAGIAQQQCIVQELDDACYHIERNANGKILFMALTIKIYHIIKDNVVLLVE